MMIDIALSLLRTELKLAEEKQVELDAEKDLAFNAFEDAHARSLAQTSQVEALALAIRRLTPYAKETV